MSTLVTYNAWISARKKSEQWQPALTPLCEMPEGELGTNAVSYGASNTA